MNTIELQQTLPAVFAGRDYIISDVWHQSLTLKRGEAYLVEAASGTGKSSLCSYVYGYRNDYQGIICFDGKNIRTLSVRDWVEIRKCSISMLFQELRLFTELTAWENVQLKNSLTGFKSKKEIKAWFEQFGIADKWDTPIAKCLSDNSSVLRWSAPFANLLILFFWMNLSAIWMRRMDGLCPGYWWRKRIDRGQVSL